MRQTALITGASGGLGVEFARIFAREGYDLVLTARRAEPMLELKKELEAAWPVQVRVLPADLAKKDAALKLFAFTQEQGVKVDVLVNNAGFGDFGNFAHCSWEKQANMVQVNLVTLMQLTHCYLAPMIERGRGKILNVASIAAFQPGPLMSSYYATKAAVLSFTEALSQETAGTGVTLTALCPGPTKTGFVQLADLETSGLFKNLKNYLPRDVAEYGYRKLISGKVVAIHGLANKAMIVAEKFIPRGVIRRMVYEIQKQQ